MFNELQSSISRTDQRDFVEIFTVQTSQFHERNPRKTSCRSPQVPKSPKSSVRGATEPDAPSDQPAIRVTLAKHDSTCLQQDNASLSSADGDRTTTRTEPAPEDGDRSPTGKELRKFSLLVPCDNSQEANNNLSHIVQPSCSHTIFVSNSGRDQVKRGIRQPASQISVSRDSDDDISHRYTIADRTNQLRLPVAIRRNSWNSMCELTQFAAATRASAAKARRKTAIGTVYS